MMFDLVISSGRNAKVHNSITTRSTFEAGVCASRAASDRPVAPSLVRLSREDEYLSEALWHLQERNRAWGAGDVFTAWRENLILERYFTPALDVPSFAAAAPPRWPARQREETAGRVGTDPGIYVSRAAPYPIYTWPPLAFWSLVAASVAAIITAC